MGSVLKDKQGLHRGRNRTAELRRGNGNKQKCAVKSEETVCLEDERVEICEMRESTQS